MTNYVETIYNLDKARTDTFNFYRQIRERAEECFLKGDYEGFNAWMITAVALVDDIRKLSDEINKLAREAI